MFVTAFRATFGVEPICRVLDVKTASVRSSLSRPEPARMVADEALRKLIFVLFEENYQVYGRRKIRKALVVNTASSWTKTGSRV